MTAAPRKRRPKALTSREPGKKRRVEPKDVDPAFLTDGELARREAFAQAFCAHGNARKAAEIAGYKGTPETLRKTGWRLRNEPAVAKRIEEIRSQVLDELGITQRFVLSQYKRIASFDLRACYDDQGNLLPMHLMPPEASAMLSAYEIEEKTFGSGDAAMTIVNRKVKALDKLAALDKLRHQVGLATPQENGETLTADAFMQMLMAGRRRALESVEARFEEVPDAAALEHKP